MWRKVLNVVCHIRHQFQLFTTLIQTENCLNDNVFNLKYVDDIISKAIREQLKKKGFMMSLNLKRGILSKAK